MLTSVLPSSVSASPLVTAAVDCEGRGGKPTTREDMTSPSAGATVAADAPKVAARLVPAAALVAAAAEATPSPSLSVSPADE
jgi:hypothetical protein